MDFGTCRSGAALISSASHSPLRVSAGAIPRFCRTPHRPSVRAVAEAQKLQTGSFSSDIRPAESGRQTRVHAAAGQLSHDAANSPAGSQDRAFVRVDAVDRSQSGLRLRAAAYAVNCSLLGVVAAACWAPDTLHLEGLRSAYQSAMAVNPVALMVRNRPIKLDVLLSGSPRHAFWILAGISGTVYGLGDITAQAFDASIGFGDIDWQRTMRSVAIGALAHGPLSHLLFSSDNSLIDRAAQFPAIEEWQQPLLKIFIDQTAGSVAWNCLYFGLLGALRQDSPHSIFEDLRNHGFSLLKAGWRIWPIAHLLTYTIVPTQHRLLFVDTLELAWITVLLLWTQQSAVEEEEGVVSDSNDAAPTLDRAPSGEMRVLLFDSVDASIDEAAVTKD